MLKEDMARKIGVEPGETIAYSKGLHLYKYIWELAQLRTGIKKEELNDETLGLSSDWCNIIFTLGGWTR